MHDTSELEDLIAVYEEVAKDFEQFLKKFMLNIGRRVLARTKLYTPVDTGDLRDLWELSDVEVIGDVVQITLFNPLDYASHVEYGHVTGKDREGWVDGFFMATISMQEVQATMTERFRRAFKLYVRSKGG